MQFDFRLGEAVFDGSACAVVSRALCDAPDPSAASLFLVVAQCEVTLYNTPTWPPPTPTNN